MSELSMATVSTQMINLMFGPRLSFCFWSIARFDTVSLMLV